MARYEQSLKNPRPETATSSVTVARRLCSSAGSLLDWEFIKSSMLVFG